MKGTLKRQTGIVKPASGLATAVEAPVTRISDRLGARLAQCDANAEWDAEESAWHNLQSVGGEWVEGMKMTTLLDEIHSGEGLIEVLMRPMGIRQFAASCYGLKRAAA